MSGIEKEMLTKAALILYEEAYFEAPDPAKGTWFTDNEPKNGFLGTIESLSAAEASRAPTPGDPLTIASHAEHLRFALNLANRAASVSDNQRMSERLHRPDITAFTSASKTSG